MCWPKTFLAVASGKWVSVPPVYQNAHEKNMNGEFTAAMRMPNKSSITHSKTTKKKTFIDVGDFTTYTSIVLWAEFSRYIAIGSRYNHIRHVGCAMRCDEHYFYRLSKLAVPKDELLRANKWHVTQSESWTIRSTITKVRVYSIRFDENLSSIMLYVHTRRFHCTVQCNAYTKANQIRSSDSVNIHAIL